MGVIRELDYSTVVKIAAGEVIDRPASIVRELLDNSLDAHSSAITIHTSNGGKTYLELSDNGCGMDKDDLALCTKNHTTSKIKLFEDINNLSTLGFRGEALSSIAEVSELTISSRQEGSISGYTLSVKDGKVLSLKEAGINTGTTIRVENLFGNMPARQKFLSSASTESKFIDREIVKKALAFPGVSFELISEGKRRYMSPARKTLLERVADFFPDALEYLIPLEAIGEHYSIQGFVSKPAFIRPNRSYQYLFVNNRAVEWKNFGYAMANAYGNLLPKGFFPASYIYITMEPEFVDVNVHPMKKEVRFRDEQKLSKAVQQCIHEAVMQDTGISEAEEGQVSFTPYERKVGQAISDFMTSRDEREEKPRYYQPLNRGPGLFTEKASSDSEENKEESPFSEARFHNIIQEEKAESLTDYRFIGIVFRTYIMLEGEDEMLFLDQHAAHERIRYEIMKDHYRNKVLTSQELLVPVTFDVPVTLVQGMIENLGLLASMGFDVEHFGGASFIVRSIPSYIDYADTTDVLAGFVESLDENADAHSADFIDRAIKQMACKGSVRAGDTVTKEEATALIRDLEKTPNRFSCPHGRPIVFSLPKRDIEKQFKRLGF